MSAITKAGRLGGKVAIVTGESPCFPIIQIANSGLKEAALDMALALPKPL